MHLHTTIHMSKISHGQHNNKIGSAESRQFKVTWQKKLNLKIPLSRDNKWQEWKSDLQRINKYFQLLQLTQLSNCSRKSVRYTVCKWWMGGAGLDLQMAVCVCAVASVMSDSVRLYGLQPARLLCPWISQSRIVERVAVSFSRGSSWPGGRTWVSCIAGGCFTIWATREDLFLPIFKKFPLGCAHTMHAKHQFLIIRFPDAYHIYFPS